MSEKKVMRFRLEGGFCDAIDFIRISRKRPDNEAVMREAISLYLYVAKKELQGCRVFIQEADGTLRELILPGDKKT